MPSQFGQLLTLFNTLNQAITTLQETAISRYKMRGEADVAKKQAETEAQIAKMSIAEKQKIYQQQLAASAAKNVFIQKIAIFGGVGVIIILFIIYFGISYIKKKRGDKYEYIIEEIQ